MNSSASLGDLRRRVLAWKRGMKSTHVDPDEILCLIDEVQTMRMRAVRMTVVVRSAVTSLLSCLDDGVQ